MKLKARLGLTGLIGLFASEAFANVVIQGTRVIYPSNQKTVTIQLSNEGKLPALVQSWLDRGDENSSPDSASSKVPFILTPPVTRIEPKKGQSLRVVYTGEALPKDRESVFYLNVLDIPPKPTGEAAQENYLQLAIRSRIKFFFRPANLSMTTQDAYQAVRWTATANGVKANNQTPYYISYNKVEVDGKNSQEIGMVAPYSSKEFIVPNARSGKKVKWSLINDYGGYVTGESSVQ